ncbi:DUF4382 domain-containing protein [Marinigracilibium pacificum]|uniref:DUF4382 domain-containing protein n=1 Tax=Marinigracilibium pacificum TaxID=2729599 RepID=A0A848J2A1_9BACT|nr:DUF4382 domain-containing protein [Marinigracilibium pacificum]NMM48439.1 DUF4382 domain-containing protein [Marinigracilibium pacificum]
MSLKNIYLLFLATLILFSCSKNTSELNTTRQISIKLSDSPADYERLIIDIDGVLLKENNKEYYLKTAFTGQLDILDFNNGKYYNLVTEKFKDFNPTEVILVLGDNNFVTIKNKNYPLELATGISNGISITMPEDVLNSEIIDLHLDFNAASSVKSTNDEYILNPVINAKKKDSGGGVEGRINPVVPAVAYIIKDQDTISSTYVDEYGYFLIDNVEENDKYTLVLESTDDYEIAQKNNINIKNGRISNAGVIILKSK